MSKNAELFEFLSELIYIQINKYDKFAARGVVSDARLNASLIYDEVIELLALQKTLLIQINNSNLFPLIFNQIKFYIEQEFFRSYASWLLNENNLQDTVRIKKQLEQLRIIAEQTLDNFLVKSLPATVTQQQCQHDSYEISFRILTLIKDIRNNTSMVLDEKIPLYAQTILRKNGSTRSLYLAEDIDELYKECQEFLSNSPQRRISLLKKEEAKNYATNHLIQWHEVVRQFQQIKPDSRLFTEAYKWGKVGSQSENSLFTKRNLMLFSGFLLTGGMFVFKLIPYFMQDQNPTNANSGPLCS
ncbi:MAG: hypothetical protein H0U57_14780 [Tatlockia sp.]|nr:hypothetical protein [Tatlockia sp.]